MPAEDPLLKTHGGRAVTAELGRDYEITQQVLGKGYSGTVRAAEHRVTRERVAVKTFSKKRLKPSRIELLKSEVEVYLRLDHPNICRLLAAYEGKNEVWLVMEMCGCELYSRLCDRKTYREVDAAEVLFQMLQAVNYLHSHCVVHRDLKLENWMYGATERDDRIKLIDFGFSRLLGRIDETLTMPCGTALYTSPEVLVRKYTSKCDIWSLGVICYMLLVGRPPFRGTNNLRIAQSILRTDFPRDNRWERLSEGAQDFIEQLLNRDPEQRPTASAALSHSWLLGASGRHQAPPLDLSVLRSLRRFAQGSRLRRAALRLLAYGLTSREIQDLEDPFLAFDVDGRGTITLEQLTRALREHEHVSPEEAGRIFERLDPADGGGVRYTPFVAALLARRFEVREDRVRAAFKAFDRDGSGYISADSLVSFFRGGSEESEQGSLSRDEAERWIGEVDFRGNRLLDYDEFLAALMGKRRWATLAVTGEPHEDPVVRVFDDGPEHKRARGLSETFVDAMPGSVYPQLQCDPAPKIIEADVGSMVSARPQTFHCSGKPSAVHFRSVPCEIDDGHFCGAPA